MSTTKKSATSSSNATATSPPVTGVTPVSGRGTRVQVQTSYITFIAGLLAFYEPADVFALATGNLTRDEVIAAFQAFVSTGEATKTANQAWRDAVQAEHAELEKVAPIKAGVQAIVKARFGKQGSQLLKFGLSPGKARALTTTTLAASVAKAKATRAARGTKGKVQRTEAKGNVTGVVITPVTAGPAAPAAASAETAATATPASAAPAPSPAASTATPVGATHS